MGKGGGGWVVVEGSLTHIFKNSVDEKSIFTKISFFKVLILGRPTPKS